MKITAQTRIVITGASGGIGSCLVEHLAARQAQFVLIAYPGDDLPVVKALVERAGGNATILAADLRLKEQADHAADFCLRQLSQVDVLVNNAGIEFTCPYHTLDESQLLDVLQVNLVSPMILTHRLIPGMLRARRGQIVNISSVAGRAAPAFQEPYAATKAGLVGFTYSLRASYRGTGVSASVICPGFVNAGIYARLMAQTGLTAPRLLGVSSAEKVASAVIRAIENDLPEVIINPTPVRPLLAILQLAPRLGERLLAATGGHRFFRKVWEAQRAKTAGESPS